MIIHSSNHCFSSQTLIIPVLLFLSHPPSVSLPFSPALEQRWHSWSHIETRSGGMEGGRGDRSVCTGLVYEGRNIILSNSADALP